MLYKLTQPGFSLIELMIVIAIISILSSLAAPSYQKYTQRARFAEVISATEPFKLAVSLALQQTFPMSELMNGAHGIPEQPASSKHLQSIIVNAGIITATATDMAGGATYILMPSTDGTSWDVSGTCLQKGFCNA